MAAPAAAAAAGGSPWGALLSTFLPVLLGLFGKGGVSPEESFRKAMQQLTKQFAPQREAIVRQGATAGQRAAQSISGAVGSTGSTGGVGRAQSGLAEGLAGYAGSQADLQFMNTLLEAALQLSPRFQRPSRLENVQTAVGLGQLGGQGGGGLEQLFQLIPGLRNRTPGG